MTSESPIVFALIMNIQTSQELDRLGPYSAAYEARAACGSTAGALVWTRDDTHWVAEKYPLEYRVPVDLEDGR